MQQPAAVAAALAAIVADAADLFAVGLTADCGLCRCVRTAPYWALAVPHCCAARCGSFLATEFALYRHFSYGISCSLHGWRRMAVPVLAPLSLVDGFHQQVYTQKL